MTATPGTQDHAPTITPEPNEPLSQQLKGSTAGFLVKLLLMGIVNALGIAILLAAYGVEAWFIFGAMLVILIYVDWVYFSRRGIALKYLTPGLLFLAIFQIFVMAYTGYVAFTNYGTGHAGSQAQAVDALLIQNERRLETSPTYPLSIVRDGDRLGFAIVDDGRVLVGAEDTPLYEEGDAAIDDAGRVASVAGWDVVTRAELLTDSELQRDVVELRVPVSDDAEDGSVRTREGSTGSIYRSILDWDPESDTMTNLDTGTVYQPNDRGQFQADDGERLGTGWYVNVGFENFSRAVTDSRYAAPLVKVAGWTFAFAILTVLSSFLLGLVMAIIYNDPRVKARRFMRTLFILPYAFPAFMSALLWRGMLNPEYGIINEWFFFDAAIPWLADPWLAKFSILYVNLWLSYPYWFLVCTGALQALPGETMEAAKIDGAGAWRQFRSVTLPLLLVSTAPLAIASFAFNFNNFTIIYMLTEGGPRFSDTSAPLGHTDILISAIYQISGVAGGRADYGLASALSIIVFIVIGIISAIAFRQTRKLEEF